MHITTKKLNARAGGAVRAVAVVVFAIEQRLGGGGVPFGVFDVVVGIVRVGQVVNGIATAAEHATFAHAAIRAAATTRT